MRVSQTQLSLCSCGYSVLHDNITLGTEYDVDPTVFATFATGTDLRRLRRDYSVHQHFCIQPQRAWGRFPSQRHFHT